MEPICLTCDNTGMITHHSLTSDDKTELCQNCNHIADPDYEYPVQMLTLYDVQQAVGDPNINYTHREMLTLAELLEEHTYDGDVWCDLINQYHGERNHIARPER